MLIYWKRGTDGDIYLTQPRGSCYKLKVARSMTKVIVRDRLRYFEKDIRRSCAAL